MMILQKWSDSLDKFCDFRPLIPFSIISGHRIWLNELTFIKYSRKFWLHFGEKPKLLLLKSLSSFQIRSRQNVQTPRLELSLKLKCLLLWFATQWVVFTFYGFKRVNVFFFNCFFLFSLFETNCFHKITCFRQWRLQIVIHNVQKNYLSFQFEQKKERKFAQPNHILNRCTVID